MHMNKHIRLNGFPYTRSGYYFITFCIEHRVPRLGDIDNGILRLNSAGLMVKKWFSTLAEHFPTVFIDLFVIMPDHVHCILEIQNLHDSEDSVAVPSIMEIVGWFKTMTTNEYIRGVKSGLYPRFDKRLWQHRFYDRVIPHWNALQHARAYILNNPANWEHEKHDSL